MRIGAVVPVYNEKDRIGGVLARFSPGLVDEIVVIDDGSSDGTSEIVRASGATSLRHDKTEGVGRSIRDGLLYLRSKGFDAAVVMAGNGKDDPAQIPAVTAPVAAGAADYVQGSRFLAGGSFKNLPTARFLMIKGYTLMWSVLLGAKLTDVTNGFRCYSLKLLDDPKIRLGQDWLDGYELEYYLHYKVLSLGYRFKEVAVTKNYPTLVNYSKIRPVLDWWGIIKPLVLLRLGLRS